MKKFCQDDGWELMVLPVTAVCGHIPHTVRIHGMTIGVPHFGILQDDLSQDGVWCSLLRHSQDGVWCSLLRHSTVLH